MTIYTIADILTCIFEAIIIFILFETFCIRKSHLSNWIYILGIGILTILFLMSNHLFNFGSLNAVGMALSIFIVSFLYGGLVRNKIMIAVFSILFIAIIEIIVMFLITIILGITAYEAVENLSFRLLGIIISKMTTFAIVNVIRIKLKQQELQISKTYWILFFLIFISSHMAVFLIFKLSYDLKETYMNTLSILCSVGLLFSTLFSLYLYEHLAKQAETINRQRQFEQHLNAQAKHLDEILVAQNQIKKFKHDFNHHLIALKGYFDSRDCSQGLAYINNLNIIFDHGYEIKTGNTVLDAILSTKKSIADSKNIKFTTKIQIPEKIAVDAIDLCIIFGNALDNAIEACEKMLIDHRYISVVILSKGESIFCKITNTAPKMKNRTLITSKKDKSNHGFGLQNINLALEKYGSTPTITYLDTEYILKFVLFTKE